MSSKTLAPLIGIIFLILFPLLGKKTTPLASPQPTPLVPSSTPSSFPDTPSPSSELETVALVIDGDTVELSSGARVRLIGVDTPETVDPNRPVGCFGKEASAYTKTQLEGKSVRLEKDVSETDRFGRLLRYVWLDDQLFNETLVKSGFAQASSYPPDIKYQDRFVAAQTYARQNQLGLWGQACSTSSSPTPVKPTVKTSSTACKYSCQSPDRDCSDFNSHAEAQAFFTCCGFSANHDPMRLDRANGPGNGLACEALP